MRLSVIVIFLFVCSVLFYPQHRKKKYKHVRKTHRAVHILANAPVYSNRIDSMISYAKQFLGCPYGRRGTSPRGFDCAGFTQFVFRHFSLDIPRSSSAQAGVGTFVERQDIRKGDILFFKGRNSRSSRIGHVALVISADSGKVNMIHAASNGITVDNLDSLIYYRKRYLGARRVL